MDFFEEDYTDFFLLKKSVKSFFNQCNPWTLLLLITFVEQGNVAPPRRGWHFSSISLAGASRYP